MFDKKILHQLVEFYFKYDRFQEHTLTEAEVWNTIMEVEV